MAKSIDPAKIKKAIASSIPISIKTYTLPHETEEYLEEVLGAFLREMGQENLKDSIAYCLRELAVNAKKANTKRVYFLEENLDLENDEDYREGMKGFKEQTLSNIDYYLQRQKEAELYIKVVYHVKGQTLNLAVRNNSLITRKEQMRVYDRIARSRAFESLEEALSTVLDDSEGAGLGLVILVLMLKKLGLDEDAFDIDTENGETVAYITIPFSEVQAENLDILSKKLVREVEALPQFPEKIVYLQKLINDPESEISEIARQISTDPSLTGELLKEVNSAKYYVSKRVESIIEAVKLIGLRGLRNLLYQKGTQKILNGKADQQEELWDHSFRAAYYAYQLARSFKRGKKHIIDDAYVGGILHDIGKIIFSSVHPQLLENIGDFCREKGIPNQLFEDLSAGLNHAELGAMIAEKWNFPQPLIETIRYHHTPGKASRDYREIVNTVYLANLLCVLDPSNLSIDQVEREVMDDFNINSDAQLKTIQDKLATTFKHHLSKKAAD
ncbi:MAG: HDOD domain-containing protein [Spirochaetales bacterium]|nr:HDOD domain-containing protein [Spirochaetales bacterium]MCF7938758.1 HDOD domain-containing protein [Spirochaetales bacterium]